jgi:hypothetical protein
MRNRRRKRSRRKYRRRTRRKRGSGGLTKGTPRRRKRTRERKRRGKKPGQRRRRRSLPWSDEIEWLDSEEIEVGSNAIASDSDADDEGSNSSGSDSSFDLFKFIEENPPSPREIERRRKQAAEERAKRQKSTCENCNMALPPLHHTVAWCVEQERRAKQRRMIREAERRANELGASSWVGDNAGASALADQLRGPSGWGGSRRRKTRRRKRRRRRKTRKHRGGFGDNEFVPVNTFVKLNAEGRAHFTPLLQAAAAAQQHPSYQDPIRWRGRTLPFQVHRPPPQNRHEFLVVDPTLMVFPPPPPFIAPGFPPPIPGAPGPMPWIRKRFLERDHLAHGVYGEPTLRIHQELGGRVAAKRGRIRDQMKALRKSNRGARLPEDGFERNISKYLPGARGGRRRKTRRTRRRGGTHCNKLCGAYKKTKLKVELAEEGHKEILQKRLDHYKKLYMSKCNQGNCFSV